MASESIPAYVLEYAPLVWLHSEERYLPSDIASHLTHTHPAINYKKVSSLEESLLTLNNLDQLNKLRDKHTEVYLTSNDDVSKDPEWLAGTRPDETGKTNGAVSSCIIVNDKGDGNVDAFYFYFYHYNQGQTIFGKELGDHVADLENNMIRFKDGKPTAIWYSQHSGGEAMTYHIVQKRGVRPIAYSARGTHASYSTAGTHDHVIPNLNLPIGLLMDHCDQGCLWDPTLSAYMYKFNPTATGRDRFTPYHPDYPVAWLNYTGRWGDQRYPSTEPRQHDKNIGDHYKYEDGPTGPQDKFLDRKNLWPPDVKHAHIWHLDLPWA